MPLAAGAEITLPPGASRHAQVRRVQPGDSLLLFDGSGSDWPAAVTAVGRTSVQVRVGEPVAADRELPFALTLALVMPANERMDSLVEKATELGVAAIQPLHSVRSVLRLAGERGQRKREHWQAVAVAACEQCGRARVPRVEPVRELLDWLPHAPDATSEMRLLLSLADDALPPWSVAGDVDTITTLSGPEGGLTADEEAAARGAGFAAVTLGRRVLRADTAPLALLAFLALNRP